MKTIRSMSLTAAAVALLGFSTPLPAFSEMKDMSMMGHKDGHGQMMEMGNMDHMDHMGDMTGMCIEHADKMGLTDDQKLKMTPVHRALQKKLVRFQADVKIAEIELMEIMEVKNFDLEKAGAAVRKIAELKTANQLEMMNAMKEMRAMLTDEQFKKMKTIMPEKMNGKNPARHMKKKHKQP